MSEYIETNAALAILGKNWRCESSADDAIQKTIDEWRNIPVADVRPVVHGYWEEERSGFGCTVCNCFLPAQWNEDSISWSFCPNCGADMRNQKGGTP